jgi:hypothetical protein
MNFNKRSMATLALISGAVAVSAYLSRQRARQVKARQQQNALEVWENEGGIVRSSTAQPAEAR